MNIIEKKQLNIVFKIFIVIISLIGLYLNFNNQKAFNLMPLISYFTILSSLLCLIHYLYVSIKMLLNYNNEYNTISKGSLIICLTVTFLIFHFVLRPMSFSMINAKYLMSWANIIVHYLVPILVIIDWLIFDKKGKLNYLDPFRWLLVPFVYWVAVTLNAMFGYVYPNGSKYPYFFLDIDKYDLFIVIRNVLFFSILLIILGYILVLVDKKLFKVKTKKIYLN